MNEEYSQSVELNLLAYDGQETHDNLHPIKKLSLSSYSCSLMVIAAIIGSL